MKFQNTSLNSVLNRRKDGRTNERTSRNQYAPHFFKVGGIKSKCQVSLAVKYRNIYLTNNQRTNGPVNAHLISWPSKAQNLENIW